MSLDSVLDYPLSRRARVIVLLLACSLPTAYVVKQYDPRTRFTSLIRFGWEFLPKALPQVRDLGPAAVTPYGYDGQFYAQLALEPLLDDPLLATALDTAPYRSRRILLPALAHVLGLGSPARTLDAYALLNLAFWFLLLFGMAHFLGVRTVKGLLCVLATVFSTGVLFSLQRALTDLPAMTFGFFAAALTGALASCSIGFGLLTRESSLVYLLREAWPLPATRRAGAKLALRVAAALAPFVLWRLYTEHVFGGVSLENLRILGAPFAGAWHYLATCWRDLRAAPFELSLERSSAWEWHLFSLLGGLSLIVQVVSLGVWRRLECPYWRIGAGLAVAMVFFTAHVYEEYPALCRVALSVTLAFNVGLMRQRGRAFAFTFLAGNLGLLWGLRNMLSAVLLLPAAPPTVGPIGSVTVAGTLQSKVGCSADWMPACALTHMTFGPDGLWRLRASLPAGDYEYKVALDNSWGVNYGQGGQLRGENLRLHLAAPNTPVTFTWDPTSHRPSDDARRLVVTAAGSFQSKAGCPADWDLSCPATRLQGPDGNGVYSLRTPALPAGGYALKIAVDESWAENYGAGGAPGGANIPFTVASPGHGVAISFDDRTGRVTVLPAGAASAISR